jgi:hypothetical protein
MKVYFIDNNYIIKNATLPGNIDQKLLTPNIRKAQDKYIENILGTKLINKIKLLISNGQIEDNVNSKYKELLDEKIRPCLLEWTIYESLPTIYLKVENIGTQQKSAEFSNSTDLDSVKWLRSSYRDTAEYYNKLIIDFICSNKSSFPEYSTNTTGDIKPSNKAFFGGVYIPKNY